jgi:hypothetical protein
VGGRGAASDERFTVPRRESLAFEFDARVHRAALDDWLDGVAGQDFSGDIYARWER